MADQHARSVDSTATPVTPVTPLGQSEDPIATLDPELRALVLGTARPADDEVTTTGDRLHGAAIGIGIGAVLGFLTLNRLGSRTYSYQLAPKMNWAATFTFAGIGAAIGGISGFARGRDPVDDLPLRPSTRLASTSTIPAFAPLHQAAAQTVAIPR